MSPLRRFHPRANLAEAGHLITQLLASYNANDQVILRAIEADDWSEIVQIAQSASTKHRPKACYRVAERWATPYGNTHRALVVHFSAQDRRRPKRLAREVQASRSQIDQIANGVAATPSSATPMPTP